MPEYTQADEAKESALCDCGGVGYHSHITQCAAALWWKERVKEENNRKVHQFPDSGEAYDATQCDDDIQDRDIIVVESERIVGVVWTWPFAVTKEQGKLHQSYVDHEKEITKFEVEVLDEKDREDLWRDAIVAAKKIAKEKGWEVV